MHAWQWHVHVGGARNGADGFLCLLRGSSPSPVHVQLLFPAEGVPDLGLLEKEYDVLEEEEGDNCVPLNLQKDSPSSSQDGEKDGVMDSGSQVPEATQDFSGVPEP